MTLALKVNARNDLHLTTEILKVLNLGEGRIVKAELKNNCLVLIPVDLDPRYSHEELDGLDKIHSSEKKKGWSKLSSSKDIDNLLK